MRSEIRFLRRGKVVTLAAFPATLTLLDYLRLTERATGTKEGCAEGDCGACTIVLRRLRGERMVYEPVNACILFAAQADGAEIITVEDLAQDNALHPVQQALVDLHGSQCGFCTPGFVMSLFALHHRADGKPVDRQRVNDWIAGNLCRCTGYRPIVDAAISSCAIPADDAFTREEPDARRVLTHLKDSEDIFIGSKERFFAAPASLPALAKLYYANPDATLVAGATDVGLWVTKAMRDLPKMIWLGRVKGLEEIEDRRDAISFGAMVTHSEAIPYLAAIDRDLGEMMRRFAGNQIRMAATVCGNIANGSPIGDLPPVLIALGATLALQRGERPRTLPLENFFLDYGKQDRAPGEFVRVVRVPKFGPDEHFRCYKISKRFDSDISAVMGAFKLRLDGKRIAGARIAFGGMAAIPKRARATEKALIEKMIDQPKGWDDALAALAEDYAPIDDLRASAAYRNDVARALLRKALMEVNGTGTREPASSVSAREPMSVQPDRRDEEMRLRIVRRPLRHDSAPKHVSGRATFVDDIREPEGLLHIAVGGAPVAAGQLLGVDLDAARAAPGVVAVLTAADIPGHNDVGPVLHDDPIFVTGNIEFYGQVVFAVVAKTREQARRAVTLAKVAASSGTHHVSVDDALAADSHILPDYTFRKGDSAAALAASEKRIKGRLRIGGQEHFYLEGQVSLAIPGEDGDMLIHTSTQHPSEMQHLIAHMLNVPVVAVTIEVRRMGGAFGGKETQAAQWGAIAALGAHVTGRPCKIRLDRDDDMSLTGKRHDFLSDYEVGFGAEGRITALETVMASRCGYSADVSGAINDRAMFHADNAYYLPAATITTKRMKTNTVSNTAFRGFGGPQGMMVAERAIDEIAWALGIDPLDVRKRNLYGEGRDVTPYGMTVEDNILPAMIERCEAVSEYRRRRRQIALFNKESATIKRGIALTPVKFGISFTTTHLNQAGALVHVYQDGSIHLNHGGTEMGQGLYTKVAQVVAEEFGVDAQHVKITPTTTAKVPNTSATAASSGSDINGMAAKNAAGTIKQRLIDFAAEAYDVAADQIEFRDNRVFIGNQSVPFAELIRKAYFARISLSSTGFYRTPKIHWDAKTGQGRPFFYFSYGVSCSEVLVDITTGEMRVARVDIIHDVGRSLNPAVDVGQIEGGFVQGMGWLTTEELVFAKDGRLLTHAPSTYKIPCASDVPEHFKVTLWDGANREDTIYRSKAVGEPPLMLPISVFAAIADAIHSLNPAVPVPLDAPATPESILRAVHAVTQ